MSSFHQPLCKKDGQKLAQHLCNDLTCVSAATTNTETLQLHASVVPSQQHATAATDTRGYTLATKIKNVGNQTSVEEA